MKFDLAPYILSDALSTTTSSVIHDQSARSMPQMSQITSPNTPQQSPRFTHRPNTSFSSLPSYHTIDPDDAPAYRTSRCRSIPTAPPTQLLTIHVSPSGTTHILNSDRTIRYIQRSSTLYTTQPTALQAATPSDTDGETPLVHARPVSRLPAKIALDVLTADKPVSIGACKFSLDGRAMRFTTWTSVLRDGQCGATAPAEMSWSAARDGTLELRVRHAKAKRKGDVVAVMKFGGSGEDGVEDTGGDIGDRVGELRLRDGARCFDIEDSGPEGFVEEMILLATLLVMMKGKKG